MNLDLNRCVILIWEWQLIRLIFLGKYFLRKKIFKLIGLFLLFTLGLRMSSLNKLNVLQWNCNSVVSHNGELEYLLMTHNINIAALSETQLNYFKSSLVKKFSIVRDDRLCRIGGVNVLLVGKNIDYSVPKFDFPEDFSENEINIVAIKLLFQYMTIILFSVYAPPNHNATGYMWSLFFNTFSHPLIILGDFNAHQTSWDNHLNIFKGNHLL